MSASGWAMMRHLAQLIAAIAALIKAIWPKGLRR